MARVSPKTVLIADDDRVTIEVLSSLLQAAGYRVSVAQDAMQAVMVAMREPPQAIILDMGMPGGGGEQVLRRLRASNRTSAVPVIVLTALADHDLPARTKALGAAEFLRKPVNTEQLNAALNRSLKTDAAEDPKS